MGLNCGCPTGACLASLTDYECKESLGQIQKVIFQRVYKEPGDLNCIRLASACDKAEYATLLTADDGTKITVSPYIQGPTAEPGAARTFGGGNQTLGGIEIIIGREPTSFTGTIYEEHQKNIAALKQYMCENVGVYLIDENGNIGCNKQMYKSSAEEEVGPIPIGKLFVGDKKLGGFEEPDSNAIEWSFFPNWSDNLHIIKRSELNFNPLTDLANTGVAE